LITRTRSNIRIILEGGYVARGVNPGHEYAAVEPARQQELDELCKLNKQRIEYYRPRQRLLLCALYERLLPDDLSGAARPRVRFRPIFSSW